jgi:hypothetical protein
MGASAAQFEGRDPSLKEAVVLLEQALAIVDAARVSPDVGARLQEVIEQLKSVSGDGRLSD